MTPHSSSLSPQQARVVHAIRTHTQLTSSQVRRLLYVGSPQGARIRSQRHLKRIYELGLVRRVWSVYENRPAEYLYMPPGSTTRGAVMHTLDISELYVRLIESIRTRGLVSMGGGDANQFNHVVDMVFDREPWCHMQVGHLVLKPDAYLDLGGDRKAFIEVDRGPERRPQLVEKLNRYVRAFYEWDIDRNGPHFPQCVWTVQTPDRKRVLENLIRRTREPALFAVMLFDEAVDKLTRR